MKIVLYTNSVSAHQLPLAREIVKRVGVENFRYLYTGDNLQGGNQEVVSSESWVERMSAKNSGRQWQWLIECDCLLTGIRDFDLFEIRGSRVLKTFYQSERWFKPISIKMPNLRFRSLHVPITLPGEMRLFVPSYRKMARRMISFFRNDSNFFYYAIGPWAKKDMLCMGCPQDKIVDWGYFVAPSTHPASLNAQHSTPNVPLRVLWVGRLLNWKRVDTIVRAVYAVANQGKGITCTVVGDGPEKSYLQQLAAKLQHSSKANVTSTTCTFLPSVPISEVRSLMHSHDVYILSSTAQEGWGAALNEAIEEGMLVLGTHEAGASYAMLPAENRFRAGDWRRLASLLLSPIGKVPIKGWSAESACIKFLEKAKI